MINERKKLDYLTRIVGEMGGIPAVFVGVLLLVWQILDIFVYLDLLKQGVWLKLWLGSILVTAVILLLFAKKISVYFQEKYGLIQKLPLGGREKLSYFFIFFTYIVGITVGSHLDARFNLPFSVTFLLMSCFIAGAWSIRYRGISNVLLYMAIGCLLLSFAPWKSFYSMLNLVEGRNTANDFYSLIAKPIYALTFIVAGSLDYYLLTTNLKPVVSDETEEVYESV
ncbi:MAG: hypothetical protein ABI686_06085 [Acidobacteriota bacterium]